MEGRVLRTGEISDLVSDPRGTCGSFCCVCGPAFHTQETVKQRGLTRPSMREIVYVIGGSTLGLGDGAKNVWSILIEADVSGKDFTWREEGRTLEVETSTAEAQWQGCLVLSWKSNQMRGHWKP